MRTLSRWLVVLSTCLTLACGGRGCGSGPATNAGTTSGFKSIEIPPGDPIQPDQVSDTQHGLETVRQDIPRDAFDVHAVVDQVGKDPAKLVAWVRDHTSWVPYRGALRGARGVLMDRVGNSVDRTLLLASLLTAAGHRVRLARRSLPAERARELLNRSTPAAPETPAESTQLPARGSDALIQRYGQAFKVDAVKLSSTVKALTQQFQERRAELDRRAKSQSAFLEQQLGAPSGEAEAADEALTCAADHWWVQVSAGDRWDDLDPDAAVKLVAAQTIAFDQTLAIPLPAEQAQELTIRVIVEQWAGGRPTEHVALEHTIRPADAMGQPITITHLPMSWPGTATFLAATDRTAALKSAALSQTEWLPVLAIGDRPVRKSSFTSTGDLNNHPESKSGLRNSAQNVLGGGIDPLGGAEEPPPAKGELTAEWI